jgi:hypothetical protein
MTSGFVSLAKMEFIDDDCASSFDEPVFAEDDCASSFDELAIAADEVGLDAKMILMEAIKKRRRQLFGGE